MFTFGSDILVGPGLPGRGRSAGLVVWVACRWQPYSWSFAASGVWFQGGFSGGWPGLRVAGSCCGARDGDAHENWLVAYGPAARLVSVLRRLRRVFGGRPAAARWVFWSWRAL